MINSKSTTVHRREMRGVVKAEMFGQLTSGLESAWNKLKGEGLFVAISSFSDFVQLLDHAIFNLLKWGA